MAEIVKPIVLKYTCPANPPELIDMNTKYAFGKEGEECFIYPVSNPDYRLTMDLWFIMMLFTPVGMDWEKANKLIK